MTDEIAESLRLIDQYRLIDRYPRLDQYAWLARNGRLSTAQGRLLLHRVRGMVEHLRDHPCYLHRPPTKSQLTSDGRADVEFLTLVEGEEESRYGLRLLDRPRHLLVAGTTGSGKTTALRSIILKIHELNRRSSHE